MPACTPSRRSEQSRSLFVAVALVHPATNSDSSKPIETAAGSGSAPWRSTAAKADPTRLSPVAASNALSHRRRASGDLPPDRQDTAAVEPPCLCFAARGALRVSDARGALRVSDARGRTCDAHGHRPTIVIRRTPPMPYVGGARMPCRVRHGEACGRVLGKPSSRSAYSAKPQQPCASNDAESGRLNMSERQTPAPPRGGERRAGVTRLLFFARPKHGSSRPGRGALREQKPN
jgi:hypothetical protein